MKCISTVNEIHKTKNLNKLLRLSRTLIENNTFDEFADCYEKIESFNQSKNFQNNYIKEILYIVIRYDRSNFLNYILKEHTVNKNFELFFAIAYKSIDCARLFKIIIGYFNLNMKAKYAVLLLIFVNKPNKKEAKKILKYLEINFTEELPPIFEFLINVKEFECFKKYSNYEYGFSDFLCEYDYEHNIIRHYHLFKNKISDFDRNIYDKRYNIYLKEKIKQF